MQTTIRGLYDNGKIILYEKPPVDTPTEVLVTFTKEVATMPKQTEPTTFRRSGYGKGTVLYMAPDFDDPIDDHFNVFNDEPTT